MRALVPQYIDVRRVYSEQDPEQIEIFVKKVSVFKVCEMDLSSSLEVGGGKGPMDH